MVPNPKVWSDAHSSSFIEAIFSNQDESDPIRRLLRDEVYVRSFGTFYRLLHNQRSPEGHPCFLLCSLQTPTLCMLKGPAHYHIQRHDTCTSSLCTSHPFAGFEGGYIRNYDLYTDLDGKPFLRPEDFDVSQIARDLEILDKENVS